MAEPAESTFDLARLRAASEIGELRYYESTGSTNDLALAAAREQHFERPLVILTKEQTGGRGRGANRWWSTGGSLTFSLVWNPPDQFDRAHWPKVALTAGIAVCRAASRLAPGFSFGLRWPNDVYIGDRKLAGILVEAPAMNVPALVIGIGLNVNNSFVAAPDDVRARGVALIDLAGHALDLTDSLLALVAELNQVLRQLIVDPAPLVAEWRTLCLLTGRVVTLEQGGRVAIGICRGIDDAGGLLLETDRGLETFFAGVLSQVR